MTARIKIFCIALILSSLLFWSLNIVQLNFEKTLYAQLSKPFEDAPELMMTPKETTLDLDAKAYLVKKINQAGRKKTLLADEINTVLPIASLTKLMTAVIVLENTSIYNFNKKVVISKESSSQTDVAVYGNLKNGESYTVENLLHMMLYYSSNDAAYALAEITGIPDFVQKMNQKAQELSLNNAQFFDPTGLDLENGQSNSSTASDLEKLAEYILENYPLIFQISATPDQFAIQNGLQSLNLWDGQTLIGGKTGFTEKAAGCMITVFKDERDNAYIGIILGSSSMESRVIEMQRMINFTNNY